METRRHRFDSILHTRLRVHRTVGNSTVTTDSNRVLPSKNHNLHGRHITKRNLENRSARVVFNKVDSRAQTLENNRGKTLGKDNKKVLPHKPNYTKSRLNKSVVLFRNPQQKTGTSISATSSLYKKTKHDKLRYKYSVVFGLIAIVFASSLYIVWRAKTNKLIAAQVQGISIISNDSHSSIPGISQTVLETLDEQQVSEKDYVRHVVGPNLPRYLSIDRLKLRSRVYKVGLLRDGTIDTPKNIFDVGWYGASQRPGDASGATIMVGHVSGMTLPGVFSGLKDLKIGDIVSVERGDGLRVRYSVAGRDISASKNIDMTKAGSSFQSDRPGLNLITYYGEYNNLTKGFSQILIVYTVQL